MAKSHAKKSRTGRLPALLLSVCMIALCGVVYWFTGANNFLAAACVTAAIGLPLCFLLFSRNQKKQNTGAFCMLFSLIALLVYLLAVPPQIHSDALERYPYQKRLSRLYPSVAAPNWFFDFQNDVTGDYHLDYEPNGLRSTGLFTVRFRVDPQRAAAYAALFSAESYLQFPLSDYQNGMYISIPSSESVSGTADGLFTLNLSDGFWNNAFSDELHAQIYIMDYKLNHSQFVTGAAIVDTQDGRVQFFAMGSP